MPQREIELAWCAGFFDGEGSTFVTKNRVTGKLTRFVVSVAQADTRPLERFAAAIGSGTIHQHSKKQCEELGKRPQYKLLWRGAPARVVLRELWPYLTIVKQEQAQRAMDAWANRNA